MEISKITIDGETREIADTKAREKADSLQNNVMNLGLKIDALSGFNITKAVDTHADLMNEDPSALADGTLYLVRSDETRDGVTTVYEAISGEWVFLAVFNINLDDYPTINQMNAAIQTALSSIDLSRLDVAVSSRAPANTALSTAQWTNARAALLDTLNVSGTGVKINVSVQRGTYQASGVYEWNNITISPVVLTRTTVNLLVSENVYSIARIRLLNSTTLQISGGPAGPADTGNRSFPWEVISFQ
jgi:hypothetical protein